MVDNSILHNDFLAVTSHIISHTVHLYILTKNVHRMFSNVYSCARFSSKSESKLECYSRSTTPATTL